MERGRDDEDDRRSLSRNPLYVDQSRRGAPFRVPDAPRGADWERNRSNDGLTEAVGLDGSAGRMSVQVGAPATDNITVREGTNPGEVVISFDAVPDATHYRIGYVNMETDYPLAKASVTGEWIEAFIYVDASVLNFTVTPDRTDAIHFSGGWSKASGMLSTVRTGDGLQRETHLA